MKVAVAFFKVFRYHMCHKMQRFFQGEAFAADYPEAPRIMLYRGKERLLRNGVMCIPVEEYLKSLKP